MNKIWDFFKELVASCTRYVGVDGFIHILCCFAIVVLVCCCHLPLWSAVVAACLCSIAKEVSDICSDKGTAEWRDIFCDVMGMAIAVVAMLIYKL